RAAAVDRQRDRNRTGRGRKDRRTKDGSRRCAAVGYAVPVALRRDSKWGLIACFSRSRGGRRGGLFANRQGNLQRTHFVGSVVEDADADEELACGQVELLRKIEWLIIRDCLVVQGHLHSLAETGDQLRVRVVGGKVEFKRAVVRRV